MKKLLCLMTALTLSGCSQIGSDVANTLGKGVSAFYSKDTGVVCFGSTAGDKDSLWCMKASDVDTSKLQAGKWVVVS